MTEEERPSKRTTRDHNARHILPLHPEEEYVNQIRPSLVQKWGTEKVPISLFPKGYEMWDPAVEEFKDDVIIHEESIKNALYAKPDPADEKIEGWNDVFRSQNTHIDWGHYDRTGEYKELIYCSN